MERIHNPGSGLEIIRIRDPSKHLGSAIPPHRLMRLQFVSIHGSYATKKMANIRSKQFISKFFVQFLKVPTPTTHTGMDCVKQNSYLMFGSLKYRKSEFGWPVVPQLVWVRDRIRMILPLGRYRTVSHLFKILNYVILRKKDYRWNRYILFIYERAQSDCNIRYCTWW